MQHGFMASGIPVLALLAAAGAPLAQPIERTAPCPQLTRSGTYNGQTVNMTQSGWDVRPPTSMQNQGHIQNPLLPHEAVNCVEVPLGLKAQLVASELTPGNVAPSLAYLMHFTFDERGRVWAVDVRDYPYRHQTGTPQTHPTGTARLTQGHSRIVILEDTNGDGALDNYKVFYTGLTVPTSIEVVNGGVITSVPPYILYLPNVGDTAGPIEQIVSGMGSTAAGYDTHGQPNSLTYGLDNWIYGHTGYNGCGGTGVSISGGTTQGNCGGGNIYRFKHSAIGSDTTRFEVVYTGGPSNAHGIGQMEDGQWFKSGATLSSHSNHGVREFNSGANDIRFASGGSGNTASNRFYSLTNDRWLWEGHNTAVGNYFSTQTSAVSGHDFYTARLLPEKYWNRFAFTCEGASALCNQDSLEIFGSTWRAHRLYPPNRTPNIFASTDSWSAPLKARTGPDGGLWVLDWYNYLFLHNPAGPATNAAWHNPLRTKTRTRLYRIIPADNTTDPVLDLTNATPAELVATFWNTNFVWRLHAQRLLLGKTYTSAERDSVLTLLENVLTQHRKVDAVGIDGPVLHALWTLHGMKEFDANPTRWNPILKNLLLHPAWTVRRNVALAMPGTAASSEAIKEQCAVNDEHAHVRVQALQNLTRMPAPPSGAMTSVSGLRSDTHQTNAFNAAGTSKVTSVTGSERPASCPVYAAVSADSAGFPPGVTSSIRHGRSLEARHQLRFSVLGNGFELLPPHTQLGSGEVTITDLRGKVVFRSAYNAGTGNWSRANASDMAHPVYFYSWRGVDGQTFNGRIAMQLQH